MAWFQESVRRTSGHAFENEKGNTAAVQHTVCLRHGDTVIVGPKVGHSFCSEIESVMGS